MKIPHATPTRPAASPAAKPAANAAGTPVRTAAQNVGSAPASKGRADDVRVSPLGAQLQSLTAALCQPADSDIDTDRVAAIRLAIANGQIRIDPSRIADGLLATLRELGQADG